MIDPQESQEESAPELHADGGWSGMMLAGACICIAFAFVMALVESPKGHHTTANTCTYGASCDVPGRMDTVYDEHHRYVCTRTCDVAKPGDTTGTWQPLGSAEPR